MNVLTLMKVFRLSAGINLNGKMAYGMLIIEADHIDTAIQIAEHKGYKIQKGKKRLVKALN